MDAMTFDQKLRYFAYSNVGTYSCCAPPEENFAPRWRPTVGGKIVRLEGTPQHGYESHADAFMAAEEYRDRCRRMLVNQDSSR